MSVAGETRAFLLTPPGVGAIAVIRVVGTGADAVVRRVFPDVRFPPRQDANIAGLRHAECTSAGAVIDDCIIGPVPGADPPAVDICTHGGKRVVQRVLDALEHAGAAFVECLPREVSPWPAENLVEAEADRLMAHARGPRTVHLLAAMRIALPTKLAEIATRCDTDPEGARRRLVELLDAHARAGPLLCTRAVALIGPPNSGKSSMFNRLLGREGAVVTDVAGTTRDFVTGDLLLDGVHVRLIDTAGRHDEAQHWERTATAHAADEVALAAMRVLVVPCTLSRQEFETARRREEFLGAELVVLNKVDLAEGNDLPSEAMRVSALTGHGLDELKRQLSAGLQIPRALPTTPFTDRQVDCLRRAVSDLPDRPALAQSAILEAVGKQLTTP